MSALLHPPIPNADQPRLRWHQLYGSAAALALAEATQADARLYVLIADGVRELERLSAELRFFSAGGLPLLRLPDWEVLPYDLFSPHPDIISERLQTLYELPHTRHGCLIVTADTLMQRLPPRNYVQGRAFELQRGQPLAIEPFRQRLTDAGYASVSQVVSPGEFAVRGSLLDVFPMGAAAPLRIDLFDDEIEAIRRFDPDTQRSLDALERVRLLPAREVPLDTQAVRDFRRRYRTRFEGDPNRSMIYRGVSEGLAPAGVEFYQPLFFESSATLIDYLPADAVIVRDAALPRTLDKAWQDIAARYEDRRHDIERPVLRPAELFLEPGELKLPWAPFRASPSMLSRRTRSCRARPPTFATSRPAHRASCVSTCAPSSRSHRSMPFSGRSKAGCCWRPTRPGGARCCTRCCAPISMR
jgi:transcription-repair coupling factor (superfamily II helicase)